MSARDRKTQSTKGPWLLTIVLNTGESHSFTVTTLPRHYVSWLMRKVPYGTDISNARYARKRITS